MKITIKGGNLLDIKKGGICHQVNLKGVMGLGLAKQIKTKYPVVFSSYKLALEQNQLKLGDAQKIKVNDELWIFNLVNQDNYGKTKGVCYTNYRAAANSFKAVSLWQQETGYSVYLPYGIGAGLGGGKWDMMLYLIEKYLPNAIIIKLPSCY